jgi:hypothetical protein
MEKLQRIQEILEILRDDQRCFDRTIVEIKARATGFLKQNDVTSREFKDFAFIKCQ